MKAGSIVHYVGPDSAPNIDWAINVIMPKKDKPYTVRKIGPNSLNGHPVLYVEEIIMGYNKYSGEEIGIRVSYWRELLPPEEIAEALEEVNEVLKEQEVLV